MRTIIALLLLLVSWPCRGEDLWPDLSSQPKAIGGGSNDVAVIVGVEKYAFVEGIPGARQNAEDWHAYLTDTLKVPAHRVALFRNEEATLELMRRAAGRAASEVKTGGTLWFVFIGHGAASKDGKDGLLVGMDAQQRVDSLYARSLPSNELLGILSKGRQAKTVVLVDACFSGKSASGQALVKGLQPLVMMTKTPAVLDGRTILMTAAKSDQFAGPLPKTAKSRPAFGYLALGGRWAADEKGRVTAGGLIDFVTKALRLAKDRTQTPELALGPREMVLGEGREPPPDLARIDRAGAASSIQFTVSALPRVPSAKAPMIASYGDVPRVGMPSDLGRVEGIDFGALDVDSLEKYDAAVRFEKGGASAEEKAELGIEWVSIPGGSFMMGSNDGESSEKPVHRVTVQSFQMAKSEVTVGQYKKCVDAGKCSAPATDADCNWGESGRDDHPVNCVDWHQAKMFSEWAGGRLPSEAEWEYAARSGGRDIQYPWGNENATCARVVMNEDGYGCGRKSTWPVCSKTRGNTRHGLCDMSGNVWEWTQDWYHDSYNGAPRDGNAWEHPTDSLRVFRGCSWDCLAGPLRAAHRYRDDLDPGSRDVNGGFRPVR